MKGSVSLSAPISGDGINIARNLTKNYELGDKVLVWHEGQSCGGAHSHFECDLGKLLNLSSVSLLPNSKPKWICCCLVSRIA